ncbi:integrase family protein [Ramlibacter sp. AN1015]|uniref:tyrosine-type recombinase/integrase n=1 Tax=Ramlibacter sp. AN1015 TaxID=3133428 RepID=UPI0030BC013B
MDGSESADSAYTRAYMARVNLTPARVAEFECEKGKSQTFLWDIKSHCLGVRVTRMGAKAYVCQAKLHGRDIRVTLGSPDAWTIQDAREAANRFKVTVDQGIDPRVLAAKAKAAADASAAERQAKQVVARTAWNVYLAAPHPKWGKTHRHDHEIAAQVGGEKPKRGKTLTKAGPLASLLERPLNAITSEVVSAWLKAESSSRPTAAGNSLRKFRAFINWCMEHPVYQRAVHADCATARAVTDFSPPKNTKEHDALQREQLEPWFRAVRAINNPVVSAYLQGLLLTGARRTEWQLLKWVDVDLRGRKLTIRDKVDGQRTIPLTPYLASLLESLPRVNEYVFSSVTSKAGHLVGVSKPHAQACAEADLPHVSLHGLRRSFATLSEWIEVPVGVVAQIQGHKPSAIAEKHYKRRPIDLLRMYHDRLESWMLQQAGVRWNAREHATLLLEPNEPAVTHEAEVGQPASFMGEAFAKIDTRTRHFEKKKASPVVATVATQPLRTEGMGAVMARGIPDLVYRSPAQRQKKMDAGTSET